MIVSFLVHVSLFIPHPGILVLPLLASCRQLCYKATHQKQLCSRAPSFSEQCCVTDSDKLAETLSTTPSPHATPRSRQSKLVNFTLLSLCFHTSKCGRLPLPPSHTLVSARPRPALAHSGLALARPRLKQSSSNLSIVFANLLSQAGDFVPF